LNFLLKKYRVSIVLLIIEHHLFQNLKIPFPSALLLFPLIPFTQQLILVKNESHAGLFGLLI